MLKAFSALGLLLLAVSPAQADLQRVEAVGTYGIRDSMRSRVIPRDEAIGRGMWEAVSRVALELIGESAIDTESGETERTSEHEARLESALGKDILPYTRSFKILKDRGEVPTMFADDPGIDTEYVVVIEVIVDVDRVTRALEQADLIATLERIDSGEAVTLEIVGFARYEAVEATVASLRDRLGATRVDMIEFGHERQVLSVEGPFGVEGLADWLRRNSDPRLAFDSLSADPDSGRLRVHGRWSVNAAPQ